MIEGQDGLELGALAAVCCATAEDCGYQCVFPQRTISPTPVGEDKDSLELWISLAYAASATRSRIEFGSAGGAGDISASQA